MKNQIYLVSSIGVVEVLEATDEEIFLHSIKLLDRDQLEATRDQLFADMNSALFAGEYDLMRTNAQFMDHCIEELATREMADFIWNLVCSGYGAAPVHQTEFEVGRLRYEI